MILAKRPSIADFLVGEGALEAVVQLLVKGALALTAITLVRSCYDLPMIS